ncbi:Cytosine deaminase [Geoglobus ahangari]|uniref:Cytosine deaminase n=1 Tax=Geoglobus ahangari TaxID=113653 RepID=A0A0F7IE53_9EURY|nr:amidohydrolase family protein [Geoglobus ahangari]AKG90960.1 Cytosine deaminase [Geoglobus ahangari]
MQPLRVLDAVSGETGYFLLDSEWRFEVASVTPDFVVFPSFFNAHTHIGDSAVEAPKMGLEELVGPGGYKFRVLEESSEDELVEWMRKSVALIAKTASTSLEFREGGLRGYELYLKADEERRLMALSRPSSEEEAKRLVEISQGFNFSSVRDHDLDLLEFCRRLARKHGKVFAIHAGEKDGGDVEDALSLEPDFIIHMNMAERRQVEEAMETGAGIVTCFRSNAFFGLMNIKNYELFSEYERWMIGTDNAMIASPSMFDEVRFASYLFDPEVVFQASTRNPFFESYTIARMEKVNPRNPVLSIVRRLESCDVFKIVRGSVSFE